MRIQYTLLEAFQAFILDKRAAGLAEKTLESYIFHFQSVAKYLDPDTPLPEITDARIKEVVNCLVKADLSKNTVRSYTATLKTFFSWCRSEGLSEVNVKLYKGEESVPETYTKEELHKLLRKPNLQKCEFGEYRNWVIINLLVNNGIRAATVRSIQNRDVMLEASVILCRHTKRRIAQAIPLSPSLIRILSQYMHIRKGKPEDYLFPNLTGEQLTESALRHTIMRYNKARGVEKTSIHMFRHTFARMYLVECGGDALKLQKLLGHTTLQMTQHYVRLFDTDLVKDFQDHSPLEALQPQRIVLRKKAKK